MTSWDFAVRLSGDDDAPLHEQIVRAIVSDICRGRATSGERLPSTRALARQLRVSRNTVVSAYSELAADGWIESEPARGVFVSGDPLVRRAAASRSAHAHAESASPSHALVPAEDRLGFDLSSCDVPPAVAPRREGLLVLLGGVPDLRLVPSLELARAYRLAMRGARRRSALDYADPRGDERLRIALADMLARLRGVARACANIAVVRGSQQALYLLAQSTLRPGDAVAVERYGYQPAWEAFRRAGLVLHPVDVDQDGIDTGALERLAARVPLRGVYVTPHHQCPTMATLTRERRRHLLDLAVRHRFMVVEDDYDHEFHYDTPPVLPLASDDPHGVVVYVGTMSKIFAPGLRLGYVAAPRPVIERIAAYRKCVDGQGDHVLERAVASLLEEGVVQRHARSAARIYRARRDELCKLLRDSIPALELEVPGGGMAVWARLPGGDANAWAHRALEHGVAIQPASRFAFDGANHPFVRIGFAACDERELVEAVRRIAMCVDFT